MNKITAIVLLVFLTVCAFSQSVDDLFSIDKMRKDLEVFKQIRHQANSGLYKYRTKEQIDSIYNWAENEVEQSQSYLDFYNIICQLTDFEGSAHNSTDVPDKYMKNLRKESHGYFPFPIKWIDGKWRLNFEGGDIPLGSEIVSINQDSIEEVIDNVGKYWTTDGVNKTGKRIAIRTHFTRFYRWHYGLKEKYEVEYKEPGSDKILSIGLDGVSSSDYYSKFIARHSKPYDQKYYEPKKVKYHYKKIDSLTGILTIDDFAIGDNEDSEEHKKYVTFLDSLFQAIKTEGLSNLIVDVRLNTGGTDPNDVVTYSYLTNRKFQESKQAWIAFQKLPLLKYYDSPAPRFLRPLGVGKFNRMFKKRFPIEKEGRFYIGKSENEMKVREPNTNSFQGDVYLLISPAVASAGSLFAAMVAGNENTITIGEETVGGYYGHNGHSPLIYKLPKSKILTKFSIDNIEQDVPVKSNQIYGRGVIPDHEVSQSYEDFLNHEDTQMKFVLELIEKGK